MIAKIASSNTLYSVLAYNQNKVEDDHATVIFTNKMIEPKSGVFDINTCLRSFEPYLLANKRTENPVLHISLNPDPKDQLSDKQLSAIAEDYMQKMGYGDQPFIVYKHEDIERQHIHIVSLRVNEQGKKINDKFEHRRSMDACRELEMKYNLAPANEKQRQEGLPLKKVDYEKGDLKQQIANVIRPIAKNYHFLSLKEYRALLTLYNIGTEEVRGEVREKTYKGLIYSALDDKGEKIGTPFNSSRFGKSVGIDALEKRIEKSAEIIKSKKLKERTKQVVSAAMQQPKSRADFEKALAKQGISVLFRTNEQGRIYGATFIDHEQKCVFNGSRLGKEFSANNLNQNFSKIDEIDKMNDGQKTDDSTLSPKSQPSHQSQNNEESKSCQSFHPKNSDSDFGGIFDILTPDISQSNDFEEQAFTNKHKKRKKKQRKL